MTPREFLRSTFKENNELGFLLVLAALALLLGFLFFLLPRFLSHAINA